MEAKDLERSQNRYIWISLLPKVDLIHHIFSFSSFLLYLKNNPAMSHHIYLVNNFTIPFKGQKWGINLFFVFSPIRQCNSFHKSLHKTSTLESHRAIIVSIEKGKKAKLVKENLTLLWNNPDLGFKIFRGVKTTTMPPNPHTDLHFPESIKEFVMSVG